MRIVMLKENVWYRWINVFHPWLLASVLLLRTGAAPHPLQSPLVFGSQGAFELVILGCVRLTWIYYQRYGSGGVENDVEAHLQLGRTPAGRGGTSAPRTGRPDWLLRPQTLGPAGRELPVPQVCSGVRRGVSGCRDSFTHRAGKKKK